MIPYKQEFAAVDIPVLTITGYYDDDQRGAMYYFDQHHRFNAHPDHYLLIGPYDHGGVQGYPSRPAANLDGYAIDSVAQIDIMDVVFQWFDYTLKNGPKPPLLEDTINFEVMGSNLWRHVGSLRAMNNDTITFYLSSTQAPSGFRLTRTADRGPSSLEQTIDFSDRSDSLPDAQAINGEGDPIVGSTVQRGGHLTFISEPLDTPCDVNGSFSLVLQASINKRDMDLSVDLFEQLPDGRYFLLSKNIARCSYLKDLSARQLLSPGKRETFEFRNTFFTSRHLQKGSRLVLLLGANKSPSWQINYGTGGKVSEESIEDAREPLRIRWFTDGSCITIPIWR